MTHDSNLNAPLLVIVGETASGKSALAMEIAQKYNGEIISADSWTVYPGFDIGTAKPSKAEKASVPHHLIDIADPTTGFSAAVYKDMAQRAISDIISRGKLPILVGGTGLYVDAVLFDYQFLEKGEPGVREILNNLVLDELLEKAGHLGIDLSGIDTRNKRRVIRAIETNGQKPKHKALRANSLVLGMQINKENLENRITQRVDRMLEAGLEDEVKYLANEYGWDVEPMKGIGYQQWQDYFSGTQSLELTRDRIVRASLGLAKRQRTWFKRNQNIQWCESIEQANKLVEHFLSGNLLQ